MTIIQANDGPMVSSVVSPVCVVLRQRKRGVFWSGDRPRPTRDPRILSVTPNFGSLSVSSSMTRPSYFCYVEGVRRQKRSISQRGLVADTRSLTSACRYFRLRAECSSRGSLMIAHQWASLRFRRATMAGRCKRTTVVAQLPPMSSFLSLYILISFIHAPLFGLTPLPTS
jgi:hypothetical protein